MENDGIIYISSGEEAEPEKEKNKNNLSDVRKPISAGKIVNDTDNNGITDMPGQKRKATQMNDSQKRLPNIISNKKIKMSTVENVLIAMHSLSPCIDDKEHTDKTADKPKLVVKERITLSPVKQDKFPQFISLCLQKDHSEDMKIIVNKLKRRYEQMEPTYATSEKFITFLNEKRNAISNDNKKLYAHITDVMNEMKRACKKHCAGKQKIENDNSIEKQPIVSTSVKLTKEALQVNDNTEGRGKDRKVGRELRMLVKVMKKCEKRITELEEEEVDFNDEIDSSYMKVERYKRRMVELWNRYCKLTGDNPDAGRPYLRPKHFKVTQIVTVDHAITNFINSQITTKNKLSQIGAHVNALIFPDYADILECISKCNETHNLALDKKKQQQMAKTAFTALGEHLQRVRQNDYWDTFSLFLDNNADDPASKNTELTEKLNQNRRIGNKKLSELFEEFAKKQELEKNKDAESSSSDVEDEESASREDEDKDRNEDEADMSNENDDSDRDAKEEDEGNSAIIVVAESEVNKEVSKDNEKPNANKHDVKTKSTEVALPSSLEATKKANVILPTDESNKSIKGNKKDLTSVDAKGAKESSKSTCETVIVNHKKTNRLPTVNDAVDAKNEKIMQASEISSKEIPVKPQEELSTRQSPVTVCRTAAKGTEETVAVSVSDKSKSITDCNSEEEKPLLRVRSFAKPPTTWEDERQRTDKSNGHALTILKKLCDKNANIPNKLPADASALGTEINGNRDVALRLPTANQQGRSANGKDLPIKNKGLITQLVRMSNVLPIIITKKLPGRNIPNLSKNLASFGSTSK